MALQFVRRASSVLVLFALWLDSSEGRAQAVIPDDVLIRLDRTSCFGACPVYSVSIDAKGNVTYEGRKFVKLQGRQTDTIPVATVAALLQTAERIGFFELPDRYRTKRNPDGTETIVTDLPTTFVTITKDGRTKRVEDYFGAPEGLRELEQQIDTAARTDRWLRVGERPPQTFVRDDGVTVVQARPRKADRYLSFFETRELIN